MEQFEEEISLHGKNGGGSVFILNGQSLKKAKCFIYLKPGHKIGDCYYNHKSGKDKPELKPNAEITQSLKKRRLLGSESGQRRWEQCVFDFLTVKTGNISRKWFVDSCCSHHLTKQKYCLFDYRSLGEKYFIGFAAEGA